MQKAPCVLPTSRLKVGILPEIIVDSGQAWLLQLCPHVLSLEAE
jgi:hypothetical protein